MQRTHGRYLWLGAGLAALSGGSAFAGRPDATGRQAATAGSASTTVSSPSTATHVVGAQPGAAGVRGGFTPGVAARNGGFTGASQFHSGFSPAAPSSAFTGSHPYGGYGALRGAFDNPVHVAPPVTYVAPPVRYYASPNNAPPAYSPPPVRTFAPPAYAAPTYTAPPVIYFPPPSRSFSTNRSAPSVRGGAYGRTRPGGDAPPGSTAVTPARPVDANPFSPLLNVTPSAASPASSPTGIRSPRPGVTSTPPAATRQPGPRRFHNLPPGIVPPLFGSGNGVVQPPTLNPPDEQGNITDVTNNIGAIRGGRGSIIVGSGQGTGGVPVVRHGNPQPSFFINHWHRRFFYPFYSPNFTTGFDPFFTTGACPSLYFYYSGVPQYVDRTQVIIEPAPTTVIESPPPYDTPPADETPPPAPDEGAPVEAPAPPPDAAPPDASADDVSHYYLSPAPTSDGLQDALKDIKDAWSTPDPDLLLRHVRAGGKIHVSLRGKYVYSLSADDYRDMTRDAVQNTNTVSFTWISTDRLTDRQTLARAKHVFNDADGKPRTVYATFTLEQDHGQWWIRDVGSSNRTSDSNAEPAAKQPVSDGQKPQAGAGTKPDTAPGADPNAAPADTAPQETPASQVKADSSTDTMANG